MWKCRLDSPLETKRGCSRKDAFEMLCFVVIAVCAIAGANGDPVPVDTSGVLLMDRTYQTLLHRVEKMEKIIRSHPAEMEALRQELHTEMDDMRIKHAEEISEIKKSFQTEVYALKQDNDLKVLTMKKLLEEEIHIAVKVHREEEGLQHTDSEDEPGSDVEEASVPIARSEIKSGPVGLKDPDMAESFLNRRAPRLRRQQNQMTVAFFATLKQQLPHLGSAQDIVFNNVITNVGNAYDPHHGVFRAPVAGLYVFSTTVAVTGADLTHVGFVKNSSRLTKMFLNGPEKQGDTNGNTIIVHLNQGDDISVQHYDSDKTIYGGDHTMISGFLLAPDNSESSIVGR